MILYHAAPINPFYIINNRGKKAYINDIRLYDPKTGTVVVAVGRGWFGSNNYLPNLEIPDAVTRRKVKLDGETFFVTDKETFSKNEGGLILYIPYSYFDFEVEEGVVVNHGGGYTASVYRVYKSRKNPQIVVTERVGTKTDDETRSEAIRLTKQIAELQRRLDKIDPHGHAKHEIEKGLA
jgi:hypothetical protein